MVNAEHDQQPSGKNNMVWSRGMPKSCQIKKKKREEKSGKWRVQRQQRKRKEEKRNFFIHVQVPRDIKGFFPLNIVNILYKIVVCMSMSIIRDGDRG